MIGAKGAMSCLSILGGLVSQPIFNIQDVKVERANMILTLQAAQQSDVSETTRLIQQAYSYWGESGVFVAPASQSEEKTGEHILNGRGFVLKNKDGKVQATFSLDKMQIMNQGQSVHTKVELNNTEVVFDKVTDKEAISGSYLEFKKLAVSSELSEQGVGRELYDVAEQYARKNGFDGVVLETVKEARWLYDWYIKLGYEVIGKHVYGPSGLETLLMVKRFCSE